AQAPYPAYGSEFCRPGKQSATGHSAGWRHKRLIRPTGVNLVGPVSKAPPGMATDGGVSALSGLRERDFVSPVSKAPPGMAD
ncbi:hypothetical protein, partial [Citrobacter koseri]|uniref:hypothetical protein n=1 Tax=Citrobacter koseri TaxID=545 RepID=UPI001954C317